MRSRSPFARVLHGPSADATVLVVDRPTRPALGCFAVIMLFLAVITATAIAYAVTAFGTPPSTAQRVAGAVAGGIFLLLLVLLSVATMNALRHVSGLAVDTSGLWWAHRDVPVLVPWSMLSAVRLVPATGPKRGQSGRLTLELFPVDTETITRAVTEPDSARRALRDKLAAGEPPEPELPSLRFAFRIPDTATGERAAAAVRSSAPSLRWLPAPEEPARRVRRRRDSSRSRRGRYSGDRR